MAVVNKKNTVVKKAAAPAKEETTKKVVAKKPAAAPAKKEETKKATPAKTVAKKEETKKATPATKTVAKKEDTKKSVAKTSTAKPAQKKAENKGGKMMKSLHGNKQAKSFEIKAGGQASQEAFLDRFYKRMTALGYQVTKDEVRSIQKSYSETLKEVTNIASFQDTTAGIFYGRRLIKTRVTEPPKAKDGLKTLMLAHYELKVRKLLADEKDIKFFGELVDDNTFRARVYKEKDGELVDTGKTVDIDIAEAEAAELAKYGITVEADDADDEDEEVVKKIAKTPAKKTSKKEVVEEEDEEEEPAEEEEEEELDDSEEESEDESDDESEEDEEESDDESEEEDEEEEDEEEEDEDDIFDDEDEE